MGRRDEVETRRQVPVGGELCGDFDFLVMQRQVGTARIGRGKRAERRRKFGRARGRYLNERVGEYARRNELMGIRVRRNDKDRFAVAIADGSDGAERNCAAGRPHDQSARRVGHDNLSIA